MKNHLTEESMQKIQIKLDFYPVISIILLICKVLWARLGIKCYIRTAYYYYYFFTTIFVLCDELTGG